MGTKSEVLQAVKQFAKEIGAPDAIICDMSRHEQGDMQCSGSSSSMSSQVLKYSPERIGCHPEYKPVPHMGCPSFIACIIGHERIHNTGQFGPYCNECTCRYMGGLAYTSSHTSHGKQKCKSDEAPRYPAALV